MLRQQLKKGVLGARHEQQHTAAALSPRALVSTEGFSGMLLGPGLSAHDQVVARRGLLLPSLEKHKRNAAGWSLPCDSGQGRLSRAMAPARKAP